MESEERNIIVIGGSAGGVQALQVLVAGLPPDLPAALFVVIHLWPAAESFLPDILQRAGRWRAQHPEQNTVIQPGHIYVAPADRHLLVEPGRVRLSQGPRENRFRPAINPLFRSSAVAYRHRVIGVILSGMLDDGAAGLWAIKECGGRTVVQSDPQFDQMPRSALEHVDVDYHVPLAEIPRVLQRLVTEPAAPAPGTVPEVVRLNVEKTKMNTVQMDMGKVGTQVPFSCPECNGPLWAFREGKQMQYSCHVGHSYTGNGLDGAQKLSIEQSLWSAVRALKENAALHERLAGSSRDAGLNALAAVHAKNAQEKLREAAQVQALLDPAASTDLRSG